MAKHALDNLGNKEIMAKNIQKCVSRKGKNSKEIAADLGVPYTTFRGWLNGECYPKMSAIELMSIYFNVQKSDLIEDKSKEPETVRDIAAHALHKLSEEDAEKVLEFAQYLLSKEKD